MKSTNKPKETTAEASQADPALQAELVSEIKQVKEAPDKAKANWEQATVDMLCPKPFAGIEEHLPWTDGWKIGDRIVTKKKLWDLL